LKTAADTRAVLDLLETQHPDADTELHYQNAFQLLTATILSAQSTDQGVNQVTPALFARYADANALARAVPADLERQIHSTGFFRQKAKSLIGMATALVERHGGDVPASMEALVELPGVGRKTANVVLGHALGVPGLPVDRHVLRVANRIGIAESDDPIVVEQQLCAALPPERWTGASDTLILHGRRICNPKPQCPACAVNELCDFFASPDNPSGPRAAARPAKKKARAKTTETTKETKAKKTKPRPSGGSTRVRRPRR
jgi:endonuclease III